MKFKIFCLALALGCISCRPAQPANARPESHQSAPAAAPVAAPALPAAQKFADGVIVHKVRLNAADEASDVRIYLPEKTPAEKLPVVLVTAAGSYLWNGTALDDLDAPEHLPYVKAGYAVVAYETPGSLDGVDLDQAGNETLLKKAITDFMNSRAGLASEQNALKYALEKVPLLDAERIYAAGHSSAATHALLVAAYDARIKAAIAYAPATDLENRLAVVLEPFEQEVPGFREFIRQSSPKNNISKIKVPVFIFHAEDDAVVSIDDTKEFVAALQKSNPQVNFVVASSGDHYDSMIGQGIPKAIEWLKRIAPAAQTK